MTANNTLPKLKDSNGKKKFSKNPQKNIIPIHADIFIKISSINDLKISISIDFSLDLNQSLNELT